MKIKDFIPNLKEKFKPLFTAIFIAILGYIILIMIGFIKIYFKMSSLGLLISSIALLILFILAGKLIFKVDYNEIFTEIKLSKCNPLDKLFLTMFFSLIFSFIAIIIYQIDFTINPDKTKIISNFISDVTNENNSISNYNVLLSSIGFIIAVAAEEILFRFTLSKVFIKKEDDIIIFIILSSILFALYHGYSVARILASLSIGIFLAIIYVMTKSIVYSFISHILWNLNTYISTFFMIFFINVDISVPVFNSLFALILMTCLLILLSIYSYCKRGYIIPLGVKTYFFNKNKG